MNRFAYVCADPGIPLPGTKGASIHVASVCAALGRSGHTGEVYSPRASADSVAGVALRPLSISARGAGDCARSREARLFLGNRASEIAPEGHCDFIYERYSLWHVAGLARARQLGVPFILEVNSPLPLEARRYRGLVHTGLAEDVAQLLLEQADGVVCVSQTVADWVTAQRGSSQGVWVVPNGVDVDLFSPQVAAHSTPWPGDDGPVVAFAGSFRPWHGIDDLLRAFRTVSRQKPGVRLLCVGDGPLRESFERDLNEAGLADRIHVTGAVAHADVPAWLRLARFAVAPYPALDNFYFSPLKLYEFMAMGLTVVAAGVGQICDALGDGSRGLSYTPGRADELAVALLRLLDDDDLSRELAEAGRDWVVERATWDRRVEAILTHIEDLKHGSRETVA